MGCAISKSTSSGTMVGPGVKSRSFFIVVYLAIMGGKELTGAYPIA